MSTPVGRRLPRAVPAALCLAAGLFAPGAALAQTPGNRNLLEDTKREQQVLAQRAEREVRDALQDAQRLARTDSKRAVEVLTKALGRLDEDTSLSDKRRAALKSMLKDQVRVVEAGLYSAEQFEKEKAEKEEARKKAEESVDKAEAADVKSRMETIRRLQRDGNTALAQEMLKKLADRYPDNPTVQAEARVRGVAGAVADIRQLRDLKERRTLDAFRDVERSAIIPAGDIEFPSAEKWREITKRRSKDQLQLTKEERAILQALAKPINGSFKNSRFEDVIQYISTATGQTILIDPESLKEVNASYDTPVSVNARTITTRTLLRKVCGDLGMAYLIKDGVIQVMSAARAKEFMTVRTYYLGDLVGSFDFRFGPVGNAVQAAQFVNGLINMILSTVDPGSWAPNGPGTIAYDGIRNVLIIKQSAELHMMLGSGVLR